MKRRPPGGGLILLGLVYGLLGLGAAWTLARPELDEVQRLYQSLRLGSLRQLAPPELHRLEAAIQHHPGLLQALITANGGEVLSPQRNGEVRGDVLLLRLGAAAELQLRTRQPLQLTAERLLPRPGWRRVVHLQPGSAQKLVLPAMPAPGAVLRLHVSPADAIWHILPPRETLP